MYAFQPCQHLFAPLRCIVSSGSPENRTQRHVVISRVWATSPRLPSSSVGMAGLEVSVLVLPRPTLRVGARRVSRYPTSRLSVRTAGFEPAISCTPSRRDTQASLRSAASGSCGGRTRLCALKGRDPQSDRRTSRLSARSVRSGPGGARTLVSWSSARRYAVSATSPTKKPGVACDTGFFTTHFDVKSSVTSANDARAGYSPVGRRNALCIVVRLLYLT